MGLMPLGPRKPSGLVLVCEVENGYTVDMDPGGLDGSPRFLVLPVKYVYLDIPSLIKGLGVFIEDLVKAELDFALFGHIVDRPVVGLAGQRGAAATICVLPGGFILETSRLVRRELTQAESRFAQQATSPQTCEGQEEEEEVPGTCVTREEQGRVFTVLEDLLTAVRELFMTAQTDKREVAKRDSPSASER